MFWLAKQQLKQGGFTLLEMVVVVTIVMIITGVVISYVPAFRDRSGLDLVAQEIAVNVRGAQVFASGGKTLASGVIFPNERPSYGIHFDKTANTFSLFANVTDTGSDQYFNAEEGGDLVQETRELSGLVFDSLCVNRGTSEEDCNGVELDITYTRPSLQAAICIRQTGGEWECQNKDSATILIRSPRSQQAKAITVYFNGQIGVDNEN